nr:hypothetical protein [Tanacetum cinerariifolium]
MTIGHLSELVLDKAAKGKAAQPSDKGDKVSVTIRDLGELVPKDVKWNKLSFDDSHGMIFLGVNTIGKNFITRKGRVLLGDCFRLREKKNKTGLEEAAKGKATQPSDKSDKDSMTIGHLSELVLDKAAKGTPLGEMADQTVVGSVHNLDHGDFASGYSCGGSLKASHAFSLVSPTPIINMSRGQFNMDVDNTNADAIPCKVSYVDDSTIVAGGSRPKPSAAEGSKLDPSISKAKFRLLFSENLCEGVYVSIPKKIVEMKMALALSRLKLVSLLCWTPIPPQCMGRSSFAHCLIEINAEDVLRESLTIGVHLIEDMGFTIKIVSILITVVTPIVPTPIVEMTNDGFQTVGKKK